jgi:hypothetical protein
MEVHFPPDIERKLNDLAAQSGRSAADLLQDAVVGYLNDTAEVREMLDHRYDDLKSGRVQPIDGEEALSRLKAKSEARRNR